MYYCVCTVILFVLKSDWKKMKKSTCNSLKELHSECIHFTDAKTNLKFYSDRSSYKVLMCEFINMETTIWGNQSDAWSVINRVSKRTIQCVYQEVTGWVLKCFSALSNNNTLPTLLPSDKPWHIMTFECYHTVKHVNLVLRRSSSINDPLYHPSYPQMWTSFTLLYYCTRGTR